MVWRVCCLVAKCRFELRDKSRGHYDVLGAEDDPIPAKGGDRAPIALLGGCNRVYVGVDH
jgi:hypothetical protein